MFANFSSIARNEGIRIYLSMSISEVRAALIIFERQLTNQMIGRGIKKQRRKRKEIRCSPLSTILPNRFFPRRKFLVEQFHRRLRNWCWHSAIAWFAPLATAINTPGFSLANLRCFLLKVAYTVGSMWREAGDIGKKLFGSPAFAIPLGRKVDQVGPFNFSFRSERILSSRVCCSMKRKERKEKEK